MEHKVIGDVTALAQSKGRRATVVDQVAGCRRSLAQTEAGSPADHVLSDVWINVSDDAVSIQHQALAQSERWHALAEIHGRQIVVRHWRQLSNLEVCRGYGVFRQTTSGTDVYIEEPKNIVTNRLKDDFEEFLLSVKFNR